MYSDVKIEIWLHAEVVLFRNRLADLFGVFRQLIQLVADPKLANFLCGNLVPLQLGCRNRVEHF